MKNILIVGLSLVSLSTFAAELECLFENGVDKLVKSATVKPGPLTEMAFIKVKEGEFMKKTSFQVISNNDLISVYISDPQGFSMVEGYQKVRYIGAKNLSFKCYFIQE
jgi:hypothetical protein